MSKQQLDNRLREVRSRFNYTQADLASLVGVTRKTINTVENKVFTPSTILALKISKVLKVSVEEIFFLPEEGDS
jgi:putative transcriptional regulator